MPTMPSLVGLDYQQATVVLILGGVVPNNGLVPGMQTKTPNFGYFDAWPIKVVWTKNPGATPGFVTAQDPAPGAPIFAPTGVNVSVHYVPPITLTVNSFPFGIADRYSGGSYA